MCADAALVPGDWMPTMHQVDSDLWALLQARAIFIFCFPPRINCERNGCMQVRGYSTTVRTGTWIYVGGTVQYWDLQHTLQHTLSDRHPGSSTVPTVI